MKRLLALILVLAMLICVFGCAAKAPAANTEPAESTDKPVDDTTATSPTSPEPEAANEPADDTVYEYTITCLGPLSGAQANGGQNYKCACERAYQFWNEELGGFQSKKIDITWNFPDTESNLDVALSTFERMAPETDLFLGMYPSAHSVAVSALAAKYEVPFILALCPTDRALELDTDYVVRISIGDTEVAENVQDIWKWLESLDDHPYHALDTINTSDDYAQTQAKMYETVFCPNLGWSLNVNETLITGQTTDTSGSINKCKASDADLVAVNMTASEAVIFQKQCQEYQLGKPLYSGGSGYWEATFLESVGNAADGTVVLTSWHQNVMTKSYDPDLAWQIFDEMTATMGFTVNECGALMFLACAVALQTLEDSPTLDKADVVATLNATDFDSTFWGNLLACEGGVKFDDTESIILPMRYNANVRGGCVCMQIQDRTPVLIYQPNTDLSDSPVIWPTLPYGELS